MLAALSVAWLAKKMVGKMDFLMVASMAMLWVVALVDVLVA